MAKKQIDKELKDAERFLKDHGYTNPLGISYTASLIKAYTIGHGEPPKAKSKKCAPYLTVEGKLVDIGTPYYSVNSETGILWSEHAGSENNVYDRCYFFNECAAKTYSATIKLQAELTRQIREIETKHKGK